MWSCFELRVFMQPFSCNTINKHSACDQKQSLSGRLLGKQGEQEWTAKDVITQGRSYSITTCWDLHSTMVECWSLTGKLFLSSGRPTADR